MRKMVLVGPTGTGRIAAMALAAARVVEGALPTFGKVKEPEFKPTQEIKGAHKLGRSGDLGSPAKAWPEKTKNHRRSYLSGPSWWMKSR